MNLINPVIKIVFRFGIFAGLWRATREAIWAVEYAGNMDEGEVKGENG
jgi:hypothetical protein